MTLQECGVPDMSLTGWVGLAAPKGTDSAIIKALSDAIAAASKEQDFLPRLTALKWNSVAMGPSEFRGLIAKEREDMRRIIESANIKIQ
jgi:tripartite-type tricarboxylate transporter receptor subunit TctC